MASQPTDSRSTTSSSSYAAFVLAASILDSAINGATNSPHTHAHPLPSPRTTPPSIPKTLTLLSRGRSGAIYQFPGQTDTVAKRSLRASALFRESKVHAAVHEAFHDAGFSAVNVPRPDGFVWPEDVRGWGRFSDEEDEKDEMPAPPSFWFVERVGGVGARIGRALGEVLKRPIGDGENCLIHPLLGKSRDQDDSGERGVDVGVTSSRDVKVYKDDFDNWGIDTGRVAESMGQALAIMHFKAGVDARGVKFVFGAPRSGAVPALEQMRRRRQQQQQHQHQPQQQQGTNTPNQSLHLWVLNFSRASVIPSPADFLDMAIPAFIETGDRPVWPRPPGIPPNRSEGKIWALFCDAYMTKGEELLEDHKDWGLIHEFLNGVEKVLGFEDEDEDGEEEEDEEDDDDDEVEDEHWDEHWYEDEDAEYDFYCPFEV